MRKSTRSRRLVARVAVAGALAAVPLAAVAGPALADNASPSVVQVHRHHDWDHDRDHGPWDNDWDHHDRDHRLPGIPGWNQGPWAPPSGSAG